MRIVILGFGRMGSWMAGQLSRSHEVFVFDEDRRKTRTASELTVLRARADIAALAPHALVNAVSLARTVEAYLSVERGLPPDCLLCDLASVKGSIPDYYRSRSFRFCSCHPMFGPTFGDPACLSEESVVIVTESHPEAVAVFEPFFRGLGLEVHRCSFGEHDRMMAYALTLPFVASMVFAACLDEPPVPGTTFKRHRGIAEKLLGEDDALLAEILFNPCSLPQLEKVTQRLEFLKHIIGGNDAEEARRFFAGLRGNLAGLAGPDPCLGNPPGMKTGRRSGGSS